MASDEMFRGNPYDDRLFTAYNKILYGNRKNKFDTQYKKNRDAKIYEAIKEYGRDKKTNASKAYGFIGVSSNVIVARVAIIRALSVSKTPLTKSQILSAIGCEEGADDDEKVKYLITDKIFNNAINPMIEAGMVIKDGVRKGTKYRLSTDIFVNVASENVYPFLDFIDHSLPFTGIIHSLYASYDVCPDNKKSQLKKVGKIDHVSTSQIMVEYVLWSVMSAYSEKEIVEIQYFAKDGDINEDINKGSFTSNKLIPIRAVYDNLYSRLYIKGYELEEKGSKTGKITRYKAERVMSIKMLNEKVSKYLSASEYEKVVNEVEDYLKKSWSVYEKKDNKTETVIAKFKKTPMVKNRLYNERRHGEIREEENSFILEIELNNTGEIKPWLRTFGSNLLDVEPSYLKENLVQGRDKALDFYKMKLL